MFCNVLFIFFSRYICSFCTFYNTFGMAKSCCHSHQDRCVKLFRNFKSFFHEISCFLRIRGFHHSDFCCFCIMSVILFILRGMLTRFIGCDDNHTAVYTLIYKREQRVCCYVQANVFHRSHTSRTCDRCANCCFQSHFFVGCPFGIHFFITRHVFQNFCTGSTRIS